MTVVLLLRGLQSHTQQTWYSCLWTPGDSCSSSDSGRTTTGFNSSRNQESTNHSAVLLLSGVFLYFLFVPQGSTEPPSAELSSFVIWADSASLSWNILTAGVHTEWRRRRPTSSRMHWIISSFPQRRCDHTLTKPVDCRAEDSQSSDLLWSPVYF